MFLVISIGGCFTFIYKLSDQIWDGCDPLTPNSKNHFTSHTPLIHLITHPLTHLKHNKF